MIRKGTIKNAGAFAILLGHMYFSGCSSDREPRLLAATAAIKHALEIQPVLQRSQECFVELAGWKSDPKHGHGVLTTQAENTQLTLECDQDRKEFSVTIHYDFDDHVYIAGPFNGPLTITYGHFTASESKLVPEDPDIRALAELLAFG